MVDRQPASSSLNAQLPFLAMQEYFKNMFLKKNLILSLFRNELIQDLSGFSKQVVIYGANHKTLVR